MVADIPAPRIRRRSVARCRRVHRRGRRGVARRRASVARIARPRPRAPRAVGGCPAGHEQARILLRRARGVRRPVLPERGRVGGDDAAAGGGRARHGAHGRAAQARHASQKKPETSDESDLRRRFRPRRRSTRGGALGVQRQVLHRRRRGRLTRAQVARGGVVRVGDTNDGLVGG